MATFRPGKPSIALGQSVDLAIVNGAEVVWDVVRTSDGWPWPVSGPTRIDVPKTGLYLWGFGYATGVPNINTLITAQTLLNGVQQGPRDRPGTSTNAPRGGGVTFLDELDQGDTIALTIGVSGGAVVSTQAVHMELFAVRIGPKSWT